MARYIYMFLLSVLGMALYGAENAVDKNMAYIGKYRKTAVRQMEKYRIPASITLAQGILESGAGTSALTRRSNNHFGIKCHNGWSGPYVLADDDRPKERFRKYDSPEESFEDHSRFLTRNTRYASLFSLDMTDYRGWAYGLKKAGYATNPRYAMSLINIIERYALYQYDRIEEVKKTIRKVIRKVRPTGQRLYRTPDGLLYVHVLDGETMESVAEEFGIKVSKLYGYNDMLPGFQLKEGDIVYLQKKNQKYKGEYGFHIVSEGESMHAISQLHAVRLSTLYKLNRLENDYAPAPGDTLKLCR